MSTDEPLYRAVYPEGTHLASSRNTDGAFRGTHLDDETNQISGQAEFVEVDVDQNEREDESNGSAEIFAEVVATIIGAAATGIIVWATPKVKSWWQDNAYPSLKYRLSSLLLKKTEKNVDVKKVESISRPEISLEGVSTETFSTEVAAALADTRAVMSSEEAQRRFIAMIIAATVVAEQFRRLQEARIEGGEEELQKLKRALTDISTEPVVDLINKMLETNDGLNEDAGSVLVELLGGGGRVDGKYVPLRLEQLQTAVRMP